MPRTAVTVTTAARDAATAPAATTIDPTNDHSVAVGGETRKLLFRINATFAGAKTYTFKAGANPPAARAGLGDLVLSLNAVVRYVTIECARFMQADGAIYIDVEAAATGDIEAIKLPDGT